MFSNDIQTQRRAQRYTRRSSSGNKLLHIEVTEVELAPGKVLCKLYASDHTGAFESEIKKLTCRTTVLLFNIVVMSVKLR